MWFFSSHSSHFLVVPPNSQYYPETGHHQPVNLSDGSCSMKCVVPEEPEKHDGVRVGAEERLDWDILLEEDCTLNIQFSTRFAMVFG